MSAACPASPLGGSIPVHDRSLRLILGEHDTLRDPPARDLQGGRRDDPAPEPGSPTGGTVL